MNKKLLILISLIFCFCLSLGCASALEDCDDLKLIDEIDSTSNLNAIGDVNSVENLSNSENLNEYNSLGVCQNGSSEILSSTVNDVLSSSVSVSDNEGHTYKINGYTFYVSAYKYTKIKKAIKIGKMHDWLDDGFTFKVKTNKYHIFKKPIYKTKKVIKYKWKHKKLSVSQEKYWDWEYKYYTGKKTNGWICYKLMQTDFEYDVPHKHYVFLKKKVKYKATKKFKTGKYKKVKMRVYAVIKYQGWSNYETGEHCYYPWVDFKAIKKGYPTKFLDEVLLT